MMIRDLKVKLTDAELKNHARTLAFEEQTNKEIQDEAKASAKGFKARLDASDAIISDLSEKIRTEVETRAVEVYETPDERTFTVKMYRCDSKEMINTRPMTANERHAAITPTLPGVPKDPPASPAENRATVSGHAKWCKVGTGEACNCTPETNVVPITPPKKRRMKAAPGDIAVTGGAGGLPSDSPALPAETEEDQLADLARGDLEDQLNEALDGAKPDASPESADDLDKPFEEDAEPSAEELEAEQAALAAAEEPATPNKKRSHKRKVTTKH